MVNKRGDTNWFMISLIVVLFCFAVIVIGVIKFPWQKTIDREACSQSVLIRGILPGGVAPIKDFATLRCQTRSVCITSKMTGKGECDNLGKNFETVRVRGDKDETERKIKMFLAQEMADCWNMFGRGQWQIFSREWTLKEGLQLSRGIVCDKIEVDKTILEGSSTNVQDDLKEIGGMTYYLVTHKVPGVNVSYMDYLANSPEGEAAKALYGQIIPSKSGENIADKVSQEDKFALENTQSKNVNSIIYIETTLTNIGPMIGGGIGAVVGGFFGGGSSIFIGGGLALGAGVGDDIATFAAGLPGKNGKENDVFVGGLILVPYSSQALEKYDFSSFENLQSE